MNSAQIMDMSIDQADVNIIDYPYTRLVKYLNLVKDDFFTYLITWANGEWNWDIWTTTSVASQTEYPLPEAASDTEWNLQINGVSINYDWGTYDEGTFKYKKARLVKLNNLTKNWNYYINNQSKEDPIYYIADKSIFLAPQPDSSQAWASRIQLKGIKSIVDYDENTTEPNIKIPLYLHDVLVQGVLPYIHKAEGRKTDAKDERLEYEERRNLAVIKFSNRSQWPTFLNYPDEVNEDNLIINLD
jgi:hypothetical protein